jgi:tetratricopeptide (TPR) repeat protein
MGYMRCLAPLLFALLVHSPLAALAAQGESVKAPRDLVSELSKSAADALQRGQHEKAESDYRKMVALSLDQFGAIATALGDFTAAERAYREASTMSSIGLVRALVGLGIVYLRTGQYDRGIAEAEKILPLDILNPEARHLLGKLYFLKGNFDQAVQELSLAYKAEPDNSRLGYALALAFLRQKRLDEAKNVFAQIGKQVGETAHLHLLLGRALREAAYLDEAIAAFKRAIEIDPKCPRAHYSLGLTYLVQEGGAAFSKAREAFEAEVAINPHDYLANFFLGVIAAQSRDFPTAVTQLNKAAAQMRENPDPYFYLGMALFQSGENDEAISALRKSLELTVDVSRNSYQSANAHFILGQALRKAGQREEALVHLRKSQELKTLKTRDQRDQENSPVSQTDGGMGEQSLSTLAATVEPGLILQAEEVDEETKKVLASGSGFYRHAAAVGYQNLARLEISRNQLKKSVEYLEKSVYWDDSLADSYYNLGVAALQSQEPVKAAGAFVKALDRNGEHKARILPIMANLAIQLVDGRAADEALQILEVLLKENPDVPDLHLLRGRALAYRGRWDSSLEAFQAALVKSPTIPDANYFAGTVLIRRGELDKAREAFERELIIQPKHAQALYHKAFVLVSQRKMEEAIPLLEHLTRTEPGYAEPHYQLGKALLEKKQVLLALVNLETAAKLKPDAYYVQYQLSRAYNKANRKQDAMEALARYRELKKRQEEDRARRNEEAALEELGN